MPGAQSGKTCVRLWAGCKAANYVLGDLEKRLRTFMSVHISADDIQQPGKRKRRGATRFAVALLVIGAVCACILHSGDSFAHTRTSSLTITQLDLATANLQAQLSFPAKMVAGPSKTLYVLDTELSNVYTLNESSGDVRRLCTPKAPGIITDMAVGKWGHLWLLDSRKSRIVRLTDVCSVRAVFHARNNPLKLLVTSHNEIVVLTGRGNALFDIYDISGRLLRSFGQRFHYGDSIADIELSDGHLVPDRAGGFYFSFNYPPLIRHYEANGRLLHEFRPAASKSIGRPDVSSRREGGLLIMSAHYPLLVIDFAVDQAGGLYLLLSGEDKAAAITGGSRRLMHTTGKGQPLGEAELPGFFHRIAAGDGLYLLRSQPEIWIGKTVMGR